MRRAIREFPQFPVALTYGELKAAFADADARLASASYGGGHGATRRRGADAPPAGPARDADRRCHGMTPYGFFGVLYSASFWNGFQTVS